MQPKEQDRDVLVSILKRKSSLRILLDEGWYHIPVDTRLYHWPPKMLAFYQGYPFGEEGRQIRYYGEIDCTEIVPRKELFEVTERNQYKAERLYRKVYLKKLEEREIPIRVYRPRIWAFISTSRAKFDEAEQLNDLYIGSNLEERLWKALKYVHILAEREWEVKLAGHKYYLDFAVFCNRGKLAIETDGYTVHYDSREKIDYDTWRRNELELEDWRFLHYTPKQIKEDWTGYLTQIRTKIEQLGGEEDPAEFNRKIGEEQADYFVEDEED